MVFETHSLASTAVAELSSGLDGIDPGRIPSVRSVYLTGSYVRADWLNSSSDVDVTILLRPESAEAERSRDLDRVKSLVTVSFPSHCPGGLDWGIQTGLPRHQQDLRNAGRYPYYGVFFFDLRRNMRIVWGEDFRPLLPEPVELRELALPSLRRMLEVHRPGIADDPAEYARRWAQRAYHAVLVAQAFFGELTLDKTRILPLYLRCVPEFRWKAVGEIAIRTYLGAVYPSHPPQYLEPDLYRQLISGLADLLAGQKPGDEPDGRP